MKTSLEKLERNVKTDRAFVLILTVLTALLAVSMFIEGFSLMSKDAADFSIQTEADIFGVEETNLYIDEEWNRTVFTNYYLLETEDGVRDYRAVAMVETCRNAVQCTLIAVITVLVYFLFRDCKKMRTPFTRKSVRLLWGIAGLIMAVTLLPELVSMIMTMCIFSYARFEFTPSDFCIVLLGGVFGMIAEVFKYGIALQEDSDSIA